MTARDDLRMPRDDMDRLLASWFQEDARGAAPASMVDAAITRSAATPRRPSRLLLTKRWPSMISTLRLRFVPSVPRPVLILVVVALVAALAAAALYVGTHQRPAPFGPARNGLITFAADGDIIVTNADGTGRRNITTGPAIETAPLFSPSGDLLAYFTRANASAPASLVVSKADGSDPMKLDSTIFSDLGRGIVIQPSWSPDSQHLVFMHRTVTRENVWFGTMAIADVARGSFAELLPGVRAMDPAWSPDGTRILFREISADLQTAYLDVVNADGTNMRRTAAPPGDSAAYGVPQWSPDGKSILAYGNVWPHKIYVVPADGAAARRLSDRQQADDEFWPTWSNDGTQIAWEVGRATGPVDDVWVANVDGSNPRHISVDDVTGSPLYWSPDDTLLFGYQSTGNNIVVIPVDGKTPPHSLDASTNDVTGNWQRLGPCLFGVICGS